MQTLTTYFPFILLFAFYVAAWLLHAACIKLSSKILNDSFVSWKRSFIFALVVTMGGWFFSTRGLTNSGKPLGWLGGVRLSGLAFVLLAVTSLLGN